jgi:hypothetical protein
MFTLRFEGSPAIGTAAARLGGRRVQEWRDQGDSLCAVGHAGDGWWAMEWPGWAIYRFGPALGDRVEVLHRADVPRERLEDTYRRSVLPLQLQALGREALHASASAIAGTAVCFCGERWAGKSTFAYALERRGFPQRADDSLVLDVGSGAITTVPLPFTPRLRPASLDYFVRGDDDAWRTDAPAEPLGAIVILEQDAGSVPCTLNRVSGADAFRQVLAHAHVFEPNQEGAQRRLARHYLDIAAAVPVYALRYAPRIDDLPLVLDRLLTELGAAEAVAR